MGAISAAEANRSFSAILRQVRDGASYVVTAHGKPVARIIPFGHGGRTTASARATLFDRLRTTPAVNAAAWTRDELYED